MIALEEDTFLTTDVFPPGNQADPARGTRSRTDSALLVTLSSRIHCRTPMQPVVREERPLGVPALPDGRHARVRTAINQAPAGITTYRCRCGFMMDAPSPARGYAAAS